jgi:formate/nitrite transporter FocA (FNT family)
MVTEEQLVMEAIVYGGLSIVLVCVMIWMVIDEKRKYDRSYGRKKK